MSGFATVGLWVPSYRKPTLPMQSSLAASRPIHGIQCSRAGAGKRAFVMMSTMRSLSRPGRTIQAALIRLELADRSLGEHRLILVSERQSPMFVPLLG